MRRTKIYRARGTPYQLEESPPGYYIIWDTRLEQDTLEWENSEEEPSAPPPPSPIKEVGLTHEQAIAWIYDAME